MSTAIADGASGIAVSPLTVAEMLKISPGSSVFANLVASSRFYGLTSGGMNAEKFAVTELGERASSADEEARTAAYQTAVLKVEPFRAFCETFKNKKVPAATAFREFLARTPL